MIIFQIAIKHWLLLVLKDEGTLVGLIIIFQIAIKHWLLLVLKSEGTLVGLI